MSAGRIKRIGVTLAILIMVTAVPVSAHTVAYTHREDGQVECGFQQNARTDIVAVGHHRHTWFGQGSAFAHTPTNGWYTSSVEWDTWFMTWRTANQTGYAYNAGASGGGCSAL